MQQQNLTKTTRPQSVRHGASETPSASRWVVDSQPLAQGKHNVMMAHAGCIDCFGCSNCGGGAPAIANKN